MWYDYVAGLYQHSERVRAGKRTRTHVHFQRLFVHLFAGNNPFIHPFVRSRSLVCSFVCIDFDDLWTCFAITKLLPLAQPHLAFHKNNMNVIKMIVAFSSLLISFLLASFLCRSNFPWSLSPSRILFASTSANRVTYIHCLLARHFSVRQIVI